MTEIPKGNYDAPAPCWLPIVDPDGKQMKPIIKCQCGELCGIGLHHVHADGTVTESFLHQGTHKFTDGREESFGCGWHVHLKLLDYDCGDFPPVVRAALRSPGEETL